MSTFEIVLIVYALGTVVMSFIDTFFMGEKDVAKAMYVSFLWPVLLLGIPATFGVIWREKINARKGKENQ